MARMLVQAKALREWPRDREGRVHFDKIQKWVDERLQQLNSTYIGDYHNTTVRILELRRLMRTCKDQEKKIGYRSEIEDLEEALRKFDSERKQLITESQRLRRILKRG